MTALCLLTNPRRCRGETAQAMAVWDGNSSNIHSVASHSADGDELRLAYQRNNLVGCLRRWHQGDAPGESWGLIASLTCPCDVIVNTDDETYHEGLMLSFNIMEEVYAV
ncbi:hypothetical protein AK812_SmicGene16591 [Symbiodinium microadriaticum]|uniref:Uncharacterized protein n=1 Tax=Symbiodinium microadriaticum TaxID=2951 RepID=A0A1Q9E009_SYMMI|nr:hypothetical protein AK812_SmicGene16591 [Symbiodinium microadriaticum]